MANTRTRIRIPLALLLLVAAACGSPSRSTGPAFAPGYGTPAPGQAWQHRSSLGGGDVGVGGDGSGFVYYIDSSGSSYTGGN